MNRLIIKLLLFVFLSVSCKQHYHELGNGGSQGLGLNVHSSQTKLNVKDLKPFTLGENNEHDTLFVFGTAIKENRISQFSNSLNLKQKLIYNSIKNKLFHPEKANKIPQKIKKVYKKQYYDSDGVNVGLTIAGISAAICLILIIIASVPGSTVLSESGNGCLYVLAILFSGVGVIVGLIYALIAAIAG